MRTTVTLDPDVEAMLTRAMKQKGVSFKETLNDAIRHGLRRTSKTARSETPLPPFDMRVRPELNLDKALRLAAGLEDRSTCDDSRWGADVLVPDVNVHGPKLAHHGRCSKCQVLNPTDPKR
ncbi:MAG: hypothetical protein JNJ54_16400 [Myxococcaceae bacterium]|nr:hypothetical protein [Myxococcaceae bacterium]